MPSSSGCRRGAIYALVALGLVVVFRGTGHLNFAAGEMATLSAYIVWVVTTWTLFGDSAVPLWVATIAGMAFGFALGAATEVFIVSPLSQEVAARRVRRPDRHPPRHQRLRQWPVGCAAARGRSPACSRTIPTTSSACSARCGAGRTSARSLVTLAASALLFLLFAKTKIGLAMRAVASNPESSKLVGVPTKLVLAGSWGLAGPSPPSPG